MNTDPADPQRRPSEPACAPEGAPPSGPAALSAPKGGRNLPAAFGVGVGLALVVIASLAIRKEAFLVVATLAVAIGVWELHGGLAQGRIRVPLVPSVLGTLVMLPAAYYGGGEALVLAFALACVALLLWRVAEGADGAVRDVAAGVFVVAYVPLLAGFAAMLLAEDDGAWRIFVFVLVTVSSDIGGYAVGVLKGKHPMAPSVSPKKSWEGFAGSTLTCVVVAALCTTLILDGHWWVGIPLGVAVVVAATVGDLAESLLKRDLGIKDMSDILPGHGGIMDRLDSLLFAAPVVWALLALFVP